MKNNHLKTAVKALKRAREKYQIDHDRFEVAEKSAKESKAMMANEITKLDKQIAEHEGTTAAIVNSQPKPEPAQVV